MQFTQEDPNRYQQKTNSSIIHSQEDADQEIIRADTEHTRTRHADTCLYQRQFIWSRLGPGSI